MKEARATMAASTAADLFQADQLQSWSQALLQAAGLQTDEAQLATAILVRTSLRGIDTHGVSRLPAYAEALRTGALNTRPDHGGRFENGVLRYRGERCLGQIVGASATRQAIDLAKTTPFVPCLMEHCGHLAALGAYVLMAAEAGMLGFICQATTPLMGLPGWTGKGIGNNPLAFATPLPGGLPPLVFDMASSIVARGHLRQAVREGTSIPADWAVGPDGLPTTDPKVGMDGWVLPAGGYKGLGIAMLVQCLCGSLLGTSGALAQSQTTGEMGAFLLVINPDLAAEGGYAADIQVWLDSFKTAAGDLARYPGQRAAACEQQRQRDGIPVPAGSIREMQEIGSRLGVPFPGPAGA